MKRTTIVGEEHTLARLRRLAAERGVSFSEVVREALRDKAEEYHPKPSSLGVATSAASRTAATKSGRRTPPRSWR